MIKIHCTLITLNCPGAVMLRP